jgi:hypothetical protein
MSDKAEEMSAPGVRSRLRSTLAQAIGLNLLGGIGALLLHVGSPSILMLVVLFFFAMLGVIGAAVFSGRAEPSERLERLIKALRGRRGR